MDDTTIRISCAQNGYIVEVTDPDIKKENEKRYLTKGGTEVPWKDPHVKFTFKSLAEISSFISKNIDKIFPDSDETAYSSAFDLAVSDAKGKSK